MALVVVALVVGLVLAEDTCRRSLGGWEGHVEGQVVWADQDCTRQDGGRRTSNDEVVGPSRDTVCAVQGPTVLICNVAVLELGASKHWVVRGDLSAMDSG